MLGFDALGRLALGQGGETAVSNIVLVADAGSYSTTGTAISFKLGEAAASGSYAITGNAAVFGANFITSAGSYAVTGVNIDFDAALLGVAGSYAISGVDTGGLDTTFVATAGSYSLTGNATLFDTALLAVSGSYSITGSNALLPIDWLAESGSYEITLGQYELIRTGDETEQVYGGVGHYLEALLAKQKLERITKRRPPPAQVQRLPQLRPFVVQQPVQQPGFGVLTNPDALAGQYEAKALQAQQQAAAELQRRRNRRALAVLMLAA